MRILTDESGQGLAEYGWTIVLVAIVLIVIVAALGAAIFGLWDKAWELLRDIFLPDATGSILNLLVYQGAGFLRL